MLGILLVGHKSILCTSEPVCLFVSFLKITQIGVDLVQDNGSLQHQWLDLLFPASKYSLFVSNGEVYFSSHSKTHFYRTIVQIIQPVPFYLWRFSAVQVTDKATGVHTL